MRIAAATCLVGAFLIACTVSVAPTPENDSEGKPSPAGPTNTDAGLAPLEETAPTPDAGADAGAEPPWDAGTVWTGTGKSCQTDVTCQAPTYLENPFIGQVRRCVRGFCVEETCSPVPNAKACTFGECRSEPTFYKYYCEILR
jgi:hypothetical protein